MDSKAQLTADTIARVAEGKMDIVNAAKLLNKSRRTIERYLQRYRKIGIQLVIHQNTGNSAHNKTCDKTKRKVQALLKKKYFDLNLTHLGEMLETNVRKGLRCQLCYNGDKKKMESRCSKNAVYASAFSR